MNTERVESYIKIVVDGACESENHPDSAQYEYTIIGKSLIFAVKSNYLRVIRRILFRLNNNLEKNFGLSFQPIYPYHEIRDYNTYYHWTPKSDGVDPNHAIRKYTLFGKDGTLCSSWGNRMSGLGRIHLENLRKAGFDCYHDNNFDHFLAAYKAVYGEEPMDIHLKIHEYWLGVRELRKTNSLDPNVDKFLNDDFLHGCGYWSICDNHSCPCQSEANVTKGYDPEVYKRMTDAYQKEHSEE